MSLFNFCYYEVNVSYKVDVDSFLDFYRNQTKVKGLDLDSRLNVLIDRWKKVVNDSSDDDSKYRLQYIRVHSKHISLCENMLYNDEKPLRIRISKLIDKDKALLREAIIESAESYDMDGVVDSLGYIVSELEKAIEVG